ncbi:hypothetical protein M0802_014770 [Mischocyttarus mexicanus]|nr:hypothetical protein M0802_014770 [Mischocyttarus mexicanus]
MPWAASIHYGFVFVLRFMMGFFGGAVYPALHAMIARWVPPSEKGMFVWTMQVISAFGWKAAYYVTSGLMLVFYALWVYLIYDTPDVHPGITQKEKTYIKEQIGTSISKQKIPIPIKSVVTSAPFLVLLWAHFANMWGIYFIATNGPKYTLEGGFLTGLPYIARLAAGVLFAALAHIGPAIALLVMTYAGCDSTTAIVMLILALTFNGAACQTNLVNHQDLAPNFAGSLYGVMNTFGSFPGFIIPPIIGALTNERNGIEEWRVMFWISSGVFVSATILFWIFGSAKIQPWNDLNQSKPTELSDEEKQMTVMDLPMKQLQTENVSENESENERL